MAASDVAQYVSWAEAGLAVLVVILALLAGMRAARPRYVRGAAIAAPLLSAVVIVGVSVFGGFSLAPIFAVVAAVVGAGVGFLAGRAAKYGEHKGQRVVKPSPVVAWAGAVSWALIAVAIAFVGPNAASLMATVALGVAAMALVESVMHLSGARAVVR